MAWLRDTLWIPLGFLRSSCHRLILTVAALASGVALVCAIDLVNQSTLVAFVDVVDSMVGRAALQVSGGSGALFAESVAELVATVPGVELAVPVVSASAFSTDGSGESLTVHGVDIANDAAIRVYEAHDREGRPVKDPLVFLNHPDSILLTNEYARRKSLEIGNEITLETPTGRRQFTIRGLLDPQGVARVYSGNFAVMDLQAAELVFTREAFINRVDVVVRRDADVPATADAIARVLPTSLKVEAPAQRKADIHKIMRSLQVILQAVGMLGLAAAFLIAFNRLATVFEERAWQLGVMRAVGVRARAVWWELIKESLIVGLAGVALGIPLGVGLGRLLLPLITTTTALNSNLAAPNAALVLSPTSLLLATSLGVVTAILAASAPAWRASRVSVLETVRGRGCELPESSNTPSWTIRAFALGATAVAMAVQLSGGAPPWGLAATFGVMISAVTLARPLVAMLSLRRIREAGSLNPSGLFALVAITRKPRRAALTVATLGVGFGTVIWLWIVAASFQQSVLAAVQGVLRGDLSISSTHMGSGMFEAPIDDAVLTDLRSIDGVEAAVGEAMAEWQYDDGPIVLQAFDAAYVRDTAFDPWPLVGAYLPDVWDGFARGDTALVSTNFVVHLNVGVGDRITLDTPSGELTLRIGGVVATLASPRGSVIMSREVYQRYWNDSHIIHGLIRAGDVESVRAAIAKRLGGRYSLKILTSKELIAWVRSQVDQAFAGLYALVGLLMLVVVVGVADTLAAGVLEQQRTLGTMRAIGVRSTRLRRIVLGEALMLGVLGLVLASGIGFTLGAFWARGVIPNMLGWVLDLQVPIGQLAVVGGMGVGACLVAAALPSSRAARLLPATVLRYE
jgi:putative ABC transport system permease protein